MINLSPPALAGEVELPTGQLKIPSLWPSANGKLGGVLEADTRDYAGGCDTQNIGYIGGWYVDPDLRLQGVGRALVEAAENWARELGCKEMASDCELHNETSFKAHLAIDYEETGRSIHFRRIL